MSSFHPRTRAEIAKEADRLGLSIPGSDHQTGLAQAFELGSRKVPNRLCALPIMGDDADPDGSPSEYTVRRYVRYARRGFGIIWFEATTSDPGATAPAQLCLRGGTLAGFTRCVDALRAAARESLLILQLWPSGDLCIPDYVAAADLAARAGFDGVDIACCHGNLLSRMLADPGESLAARARSLRQIVQAVRAACPELAIAVRLDAYQARTNGFGVDRDDYRRMDPTEPEAVARWLRDDGVGGISITLSNPNLFGDPSRRGNEPMTDAEAAHEHPLTVLARHQRLGRLMREAAPGLAVIGGGYSWLGPLALELAAGAVEEGAADFVGLGRLALLDPALPGMCSLLPFAESDLWEDGGPFGRRPARDAGYRNERMEVFDQIQALSGDDEMLLAFQEGRLENAFRILRRENPLPEMSSHIRSDPVEPMVGPFSAPCPVAGPRLPGRADVLRQLQYMIAWTARNMGVTGVRVSAAPTGRRIAVIGGGPAGLAATVRLLESGHGVFLFEREDRLGGAPALVYPEDRSPDPHAEIEALFQPALKAGRLAVALGHAASAQELLADHDAVLVATGCWSEPSLGTATGIWPALRFLTAARSGACTRVPSCVMVLCGGDAAMDAAVTAKRLGAERLELLFESSRRDAHWHLPEAWFETEGVHAQFEARAIAYCVDGDGAVRGVVLEGNERVDADMVIEAMGLVADPIDTKSKRVFRAGALVNGGASVEQCMREGSRVAEIIDRFIRGGHS